MGLIIQKYGGSLPGGLKEERTMPYVEGARNSDGN